jgi:TPR repeat protein
MKRGRHQCIVRRLAIALGVIPIAAWLVATPALADKRVALVIGNSAYRSVSRLDNPANDAKLMADTLRNLGFTLVGGGAQLDLSKAQFEGALQTFGDQAQGADVDLFYYAGHGVQVRGKNFLAPVEASLTKEADIYLQMVDAEAVLSQMEGSGAKLNLVILDACRNNPFGGGRLRAISGGLAQMQAPEGTLISYATQPGNVAQDGADGDSPYTKALVATIGRPGIGLFDVFNEVGLSVKRATGGVQQPWVSSSPIEGGFYFAGRPAVDPALVAANSDRTDLQPAPDKKMPVVSMKVAARDEQVSPARATDPQDAPKPAATPVAPPAPDPAPLAQSAALVGDDTKAAGPGNESESAIGACDRLTSFRLGPARATDGAALEFDRGEAIKAVAVCQSALANEPGNLRLMFNLGRAQARVGSNPEAIALFRKAAEAGHAGAMYSLGLASANGAGVAKDLAEAGRWYRKAADAGNAIAMGALGLAYEEGAGVEADPVVAMLWCRKAAEAGDTPAMNRLGLAYANGFGVARDLTRSINWFRRGAEAGGTRAMVNLGLAYAQGDGVPKDAVEAARWFRKAAEAGNTFGMNHLGFAYERGKGVARDPAEAVRWYQKAAEAGNIYAMNNLGLAYRNGFGVARNEEEAERWLLKARQ